MSPSDGLYSTTEAGWMLQMNGAPAEPSTPRDSHLLGVSTDFLGRAAIGLDALAVGAGHQFGVLRSVDDGHVARLRLLLGHLVPALLLGRS